MWMSRTRGVQFHELIHIRLIRWVGSVFIRLFFMCVTNSLSAVSRTHSYVTHRRVGTVFMWVFLICLSRTRWVQYPELIHIWLIRRVGTVFMHVFFMCVSRTHRVPWVSHMHSFTWFIDESALCLCMVLYVCVTNSWISLSITRSFMHSCMIYRRDGSVCLCVFFICVSRTRCHELVDFPEYVHSCMTYRRDGSAFMCVFFTCVSRTRWNKLVDFPECHTFIHVWHIDETAVCWCVCSLHVCHKLVVTNSMRPLKIVAAVSHMSACVPFMWVVT